MKLLLIKIKVQRAFQMVYFLNRQYKLLIKTVKASLLRLTQDRLVLFNIFTQVSNFRVLFVLFLVSNFLFRFIALFTFTVTASLTFQTL